MFAAKFVVNRTNGLVADTVAQGEILTEGEEKVVSHIRRSSFYVVKKAKDMKEETILVTVLMVMIIMQ
jgi:diacylglycerol kinase